VDAWEKYLREKWGLSESFARKAALLVNWFFAYGLRPSIVRGHTSAEHQRQLQQRWDRGDRAGLRVRPATDSLHTREDWGNPAAEAIDITTTDDAFAARIAEYLGIGAGWNFKTPDAGHYYGLNA